VDRLFNPSVAGYGSVANQTLRAERNQGTAERRPRQRLWTRLTGKFHAVLASEKLRIARRERTGVEIDSAERFPVGGAYDVSGESQFHASVFSLGRCFQQGT
jgi:hypothetical protein